jgi:signal transduction histidine kinase
MQLAMIRRCPREPDLAPVPPSRAMERGHQCLAHDLLSAHEDERQRIAADLHDGIGQQLSAIKFGLEGALRGLVDRLTPAERGCFETLVTRVGDTIEEARRIAMDLRPPILDDFGATYAVDWLCGELTRVYEAITVIKELNADEDAIPTEIKVDLFRILQEACNNACKHARADRITVRLYTDAEGIRLQVSDNGVGFDPRAVKRLRTGFGLRSMRERALSTGGSLTVSSGTGKGTTVLAHWPVRRMA